MTKYYQVPKKLDQLHLWPSNYTLIGNEILTKKEADKMQIRIEVLIPLPDIKTEDTYMCFGARFLNSETDI